MNSIQCTSYFSKWDRKQSLWPKYHILDAARISALSRKHDYSKGDNEDE